MNELLMRLTAAMPMKQINIYQNGTALDHPKNTINCQYDGDDLYHWDQPYLQRYFAGIFRDGSDLWLHRFLSADGERHLHSHPFEFETIMLHGGYVEEFINSHGLQAVRETFPDPESDLPRLIEEFLLAINKIESRKFLEYGCMGRSLNLYDWHRIVSVFPETWTAVIVKPKRLPKWFFKDDNGDLSDMNASPRDWWKDYKIRPESGIAGDDNRF